MNPEPDWNLYRTFLAVVREGSLSGAARRLGLTQPTVARHVETLEQSIGADLFLRSQRGLSPTEMAVTIRPYAETLASTASALMRSASGHSAEVRGVVRISASEIVGVELIPPILARLRQQHPALVIELALSNTVENLLQREADIAVRMVEPVQDALIARHLPSIELGLHAHRAYLERCGTPSTPEDLHKHDLIGFDRQTPTLTALVSHIPALARSKFAFRADSDLAQLAAIRAGCGIGICQVRLAKRDPDLVRVLAADVRIELGLWIVMHEDLKTSARCRTVFDALANGLGPTAQSIDPQA